MFLYTPVVFTPVPGVSNLIDHRFPVLGRIDLMLLVTNTQTIKTWVWIRNNPTRVEQLRKVLNVRLHFEIGSHMEPPVSGERPVFCSFCSLDV